MEEAFLIECIENETENSYYDFKKDIYDFNIQKSKEDFLVDVISFANNHSKGNKYIITGVKLHEDNSRTLEGITESKIKDGADYQSLVNDNIEPNVIIDFKIVDYIGKKFGILRINEGNNDPPYFLSKQYGNLPKGFIKIRKGQKNEFVTRRDFDLFYNEKTNNEMSNICLRGIINKNISDTFKIEKFQNKIDFEKCKNKIYELFTEISEIKLERSLKSALKFGSELYVDQEDIDIIRKYSQKNNIILKDNFFDIGYITSFSILYSSTNYYGTESEKKKYKLICNLSKMISIFEGYKKFYDNIDKISYTELAIQNKGRKFDEDIEVTLKLKKENLFNYDDFPIPSEDIIEDVIDGEFIGKYLEIEKNSEINEYTGKYIRNIPSIPRSIKLSTFGYSDPSYESYIEYFKEYVKSVADYDIIETENYYFLKYEQKNIKPNEVISLPSKILFRKIPEDIEYEIKTKYNPNIQKGKILNNNK